LARLQATLSAVKRLSSWKRTASRKVEHSALVVVGVHGPAFSETGLQAGRLIRFREIPGDQRVVESDAQEAVAIGTVAELACVERDVGDGYRDAQRYFAADVVMNVNLGGDINFYSGVDSIFLSYNELHFFHTKSGLQRKKYKNAYHAPDKIIIQYPLE